MLLTYWTSEDAGWLLVSPSGWLIAPHTVEGFSPGHGSWWSPESQTFHVAWFTQNAPENVTFTLHLTEISADGQSVETRSLPFEWDAPVFRHVRPAGPRSVCVVGGEMVVVTDAGRCSLVVDDDVARCGEIQAPELVACINEERTMGYDNAVRLTQDGLVPYPRPILDGGDHPVLDSWYAFDDTGQPRLVTKRWTGEVQEFFDGAWLYTTFDGEGQTRIVRSRIDDSTETTEVTIDGDGYMMLFPTTGRLTLFGFRHMAVVETTGFGHLN